MSHKELVEEILSLWKDGKIGKIEISRRFILDIPDLLTAIYIVFHPLTHQYNPISESYTIVGVSRLFYPRPGLDPISYIFEFNSSGQVSGIKSSEGT